MDGCEGIVTLAAIADCSRSEAFENETVARLQLVLIKLVTLGLFSSIYFFLFPNSTLVLNTYLEYLRLFSIFK